MGKDSRWAAILAIFPAILTLCFCITMGEVLEAGPITVNLPWVPSLGLMLSFYADGLSLLFAILIAGIGSLVVLFASQDLKGDPRSGQFQATLFAFMGSMLGVVLADNLFALFVFWELTGFTSFLLIGYYNNRAEARASAIQAFIVTGTGGMALLAAAALLEIGAGSHSFSELLSGNADIRSASAYPWIALLVLLAAFTKSAQTPFHFWLPNAMTAPTPVSAYLHSATMVKAGLYLVARSTPILGGTDLWTGTIVTAGTVTMAVGAWRALAETDLKKVLAFTTVSALGLIMMLLGFGTDTAVTAALVFLVAHACYKGALFLIAGTLEHEAGSRDIRELGGLRHAMPLTALGGLLAALSMAGLPFFTGFIGKELAYDALLGQASPGPAVLLPLTVGASMLLGAAALVAGVAPFIGEMRKAAPTRPVPLALSLPPIVLAVAGAAVGVYPSLLDGPVSLMAANVIGKTVPVHLALWHGFTPVLLLSVLTLAGAASLYAFREAIRRRIWPRTFGFERLYTGGLGALDKVSAWSVPAMQDGSLRSYVLILILAATSLIAGVIAWAGLPPMPPMTEIRPAEAAVAIMIIAGAISAARARATMTAVLSLGVTGYGVALTFLFFGAPDLAMTQFSVETLTVIIFTLVFYHFRRFRSHSNRMTRLRDLSVSILFGGSLATVLFFVGAAHTPFGLGSYFAGNSAALAHGRNIVNVILVDFRALDTLGEITVLATAALGVRALLRMSKRDEKKP